MLCDGFSWFVESSGSQTDRAFVATRAAEPTVAIATTDLKILATIGFGGLSTTGAAANPFEVYARELPQGAVPSAVGSSAHVKCSISDGLIVPMSMGGSHLEVATIQLMCHALLGTGGSSGARPFVFTQLGTIATAHSPEPATNNLYVANTIHYTSGASSPAVSPRLVQGITDIQVNFGVNVFKESTDSDVYPNFAAIMGRMPSIEFNVRDAALAIEIGDGIAVSEFTAYFQNVATNGQRTAKASALHISVAGTTGMITPNTLSLAHKAPLGCSFRFTPAAAAPCIAIATTSTIPTTA
jgi:hypothetical protein